MELQVLQEKVLHLVQQVQMVVLEKMVLMDLVEILVHQVLQVQMDLQGMME